jgi:hypothetical protein
VKNDPAWLVSQLTGGCVLYRHPRFWGRPAALRAPAQINPAVSPAADPKLQMTFGRYRGCPINLVIDDAGYAGWLLSQTWFAEKHPQHHKCIEDALARTLADAEGDPAGHLPRAIPPGISATMGPRRHDTQKRRSSKSPGGSGRRAALYLQGGALGFGGLKVSWQTNWPP